MQEIFELAIRLKRLCVENKVEMNLILLYDGLIRCYGCGDYPVQMADAMITVIEQKLLNKKIHILSF